jgi:hypothetical protein
MFPVYHRRNPPIPKAIVRKRRRHETDTPEGNELAKRPDRHNLIRFDERADTAQTPR